MRGIALALIVIGLVLIVVGIRGQLAPLLAAIFQPDRVGSPDSGGSGGGSFG